MTPQPGLARGARTAAPVRHVHLGLGNFFRAHQAVYTQGAPDAEQWGIAAFSGRSAALAAELTAQQCRYTLLTRSAAGDRFDVIDSVSAAHAATENEQWLRYLADPQVRILTLTVTEAGYQRAPDGAPERGSGRVQRDVAALRADPAAAVSTVPGRIVAGLQARRRADAGPITLVPCDNLPENGTVLARVVREFAAWVDPGLVDWITESVDHVSTVVDRITPRTTDSDRAAVGGHCGYLDLAPVVTEPFSEWVLSGDFRGGRPSWDAAGAVFTVDVAPYEQRKLWLLNGAHSLLAYTAPLLGHRTVADAIGDDRCRAWVEQWWDESTPHLSMPVPEIEAYRVALIGRFVNPRIEHQLVQIAMDGSVKLPVRILPVVHAERAQGRLPVAAIRVLAGWVCHLRGVGAAVHDPAAPALIRAAAGPVPEGVRAVLRLLDPELGDDAELVAAIAATVIELAG